MFNPNEHLIQLKGKDYLQVMWRLVWFREDKPGWGIETLLVDRSDEHAVFVAKIVDDSGIQKSSGYGSETKKDFGDFLEKAETKAVGRALAMLGYGTQFAPELDEGERIVDSPVPKKDPLTEIYSCERCGSVFMPFDYKGKKYTAKDAFEGAKKAGDGHALCKSCRTPKADG